MDEGLIVLYLLFHFPAFMMLLWRLKNFKKDPIQAKKVLIAAGIYFLVGGGLCSILKDI